MSDDAKYLVPGAAFEAIMTMLIDSGDMTLMARQMLRKLMSEDNALVSQPHGWVLASEV